MKLSELSSTLPSGENEVEVAVGLADLTDPDAVLKAASEYDQVGRQGFLAQYYFGAARQYFLRLNGRLYDAKAIVGVAHGYQTSKGALSNDQLSGGVAAANRALERLGFEVINSHPTDTDAELQWRLAVWSHLRAISTTLSTVVVRPAELHAFGAYGGAQGVWVDAKRTKLLHRDGIAVSVLHTGRHYPDDLSSDGILYHYPDTNRPPGRDESEVRALKAASELWMPIFVVTQPSATMREVRLGWIEGWEDKSKLFSIAFSETPPPLAQSEAPALDEPFDLMRLPHKTSTRRVRQRPNQRMFKLRVFRRYGPRCPLSGVSVPELLEAAHIVGYAKGGTDDPRNGLPLNVAVHRAFDAGLFAINPDTLEVETRPSGPDADALGIRYPAGVKDLPMHPHQDALRWAYERWQGQG
ncbi:HNH endonuclease [Nonomuraea sp. NPDC047897]|uniref:HNH endonuclease n=1 Tax=Nonomuraea sp. NPDC047897 TaxID=3364346 RepID=UPI0037249688